MISFFRKTRGSDSRLGLVLDAESGGAAALLRRKGGRLRLEHWARSEPATGDSWPLAELCDGRKDPISVVLNLDAYQMLMVDRPDVPLAELADAVKWRIRDRLNTKVEDAIVDVFEMPRQARGARELIHAVATSGQMVEQIAAQLSAASLKLDTVDIPELCLRNLASALPQSKFGVACLLVRGQRGILTLSRDDSLYLVRQMEVPASLADNSQAVSNIALEVQRSLDYFESHFDQRPIRDVVLAPSHSQGELVTALNAEMAVNVSGLDLNSILESPRPLTPEEQADCLLAVGAAMRQPARMDIAA